MQLALAYLDASAIEEVPLTLWRDVFDAYGWPASLADKRDTFSHTDLQGALRDDDLSDGLRHGLETIHTLGTEPGREAIVSAMNARGVRLKELPPETSARELAMHLYMAQRGDASLADVFARAQTQVQEGGLSCRYHEYLGKESKTVTNLEKKKIALHAEVLRHCRESDLGEHVQVNAFKDDGTYVFSIMRSDRTKKPLAVVSGHSARTTIAYRPVHGDILRYEADVGRLRISARAASIIEFYRGTLGRILFDDIHFFSGDAVCSLTVLQEKGCAAFVDHNVYGIGRIWMTECLWERGDRDLITFRSTDCFRSTVDLGVDLTKGTLISAKLKVEVIGKSTRPVTVTIRVPSRIEVTQRSHEDIIDKLLDVVGIRNSRAASPKMDLWSLHPWRHPLSIWRALFGAETDTLVKNGALVSVQLESVAHPEHPDAGRVLKVERLANGEFHGVSGVAEIPSRALSPTDIEGLELQPEKLRLYLRTKLSISIRGVPWSDGEVLELGTIEVGDESFYLAYALRKPPRGVGGGLRARANGAHIALLMPASQTDDTDIAKVILDGPSPSRRFVIRAAIAANGLNDKMPAVYCSPDRARLVVDLRLKKAWIDGIELTDLKPDSHVFRFIEILANSGGNPISTVAITEALSPARADGDTTARSAKLSAKKLINKAMADAGHTIDNDIFPSAGTGHYRCTLPSFVA